jgi:hypothetical protein
VMFRAFLPKIVDFFGLVDSKMIIIDVSVLSCLGY